MSIEQQVKDIVAEQLGVSIDEVKNESSFQDDLGADSLDTVELVMALEEAFGCEIPDEDAEKITTVQAAIDYVNAKQPENQLPNHSIILIKEKHHESKTCSHHRLRANFPRR